MYILLNWGELYVNQIKVLPPPILSEYFIGAERRELQRVRRFFKQRHRSLENILEVPGTPKGEKSCISWSDAVIWISGSTGVQNTAIVTAWQRKRTNVTF